jgi:hypothetical protein
MPDLDANANALTAPKGVNEPGAGTPIGQPVTFTATAKIAENNNPTPQTRSINGPGGGVPTGTVDFKTAALTPGRDPESVGYLTASPHTISASYSGTASFNTATPIQFIAKAADGKALPNAEVKIQNEAGQTVTSVKADAAGAVSWTPDKPGKYTLTVFLARGFFQ